MFSLTPLDPDNIEHINFTYDILKARYAAQDEIHITDYETTPSIEEHVNTLKNNYYKYFYIGKYQNIPCMILYVKQNKEYETGFYYMPKKWTEVYRRYKSDLLQLLEKYDGELPMSKALVSVVTSYFYKKLFKTHPHLEKDLTCRIHYKNILSQEVARLSGFKPLSIHYKFNLPDIGYKNLPNTWRIRHIDINNREDIEFTYEILKMRFNTPHINIGTRVFPSIDEHENFLKTNYRYYYICSLNDLQIAVLYITNDYEGGWFFHLDNLKTGIRRYRHDVRKVMNVMYPKLSLTQAIPALYHREIVTKHEELQTKMCASINVNNTWSNSTATVVGYEPLYISYVR